MATLGGMKYLISLVCHGGQCRFTCIWPFAKISVHISLISLVVILINDLIFIYILDESLTDT